MREPWRQQAIFLESWSEVPTWYTCGGSQPVGRQFLVSERFTAADLTFAALASPMLLPSQCGASYPAVDDVPAAMREEVLRLRHTDAGRFALKLYAQRVRSPDADRPAIPA